MHVPASYTGKARVPLVIDMHGSGQSATAQIAASTWGKKADAEGFILICPNALNAPWNAGTCCSPSMEQNVDDLGFIRAVVEKATTDGCNRSETRQRRRLVWWRLEGVQAGLPGGRHV